MRLEAERVLSLRLRPPGGGVLPAWEPGAHVDLRLPGGTVRQYSLNGSPDDRRSWRLSVLHETASRGGSEAVHRTLRVGDTVEVTGPRNTFPLVGDSPEYLFVAGGIGITPILPMVDRVAARGARWSLLYGGRTRPAMAFLDHLARYGDRVRVRPQDTHGLLDLGGFLGSPRPGTVVYACGPEPLLAALEEQCRAWPAGTLRVERFAARLPAAPGGAEQEFEVVLNRSGRTVAVPSGSSVLEALEDNGLRPANSCRQGICGTCETKVLDGVPEHRDSLLSQEERDANDTMMICVGRARSERLVLDL
ncbi:PDR/VanB family oxidoreductase [Streptomyces sp. NPDC003023]|uniref:PDR/VanB family oxidoreductase n=1 Tax=Streptomyces sp. NPDC003023 TaxID=3364675 RepID=UPI00368551A6